MTNYPNLILDGEVYIHVDIFFSMHSAFDSLMKLIQALRNLRIFLQNNVHRKN